VVDGHLLSCFISHENQDLDLILMSLVLHHLDLRAGSTDIASEQGLADGVSEDDLEQESAIEISLHDRNLTVAASLLLWDKDLELLNDLLIHLGEGALLLLFSLLSGDYHRRAVVLIIVVLLVVLFFIVIVFEIGRSYI